MCYRGDTLLQQLTKLWEGFVRQTDITIQDFLSVEHLGFVLRRLQRKLKQGYLFIAI